MVMRRSSPSARLISTTPLGPARQGFVPRTLTKSSAEWRQFRNHRHLCFLVLACSDWLHGDEARDNRRGCGKLASFISRRQRRTGLSYARLSLQHLNPKSQRAAVAGFPIWTPATDLSKAAGGIWHGTMPGEKLLSHRAFPAHLGTGDSAPAVRRISKSKALVLRGFALGVDVLERVAQV